MINKQYVIQYVVCDFKQRQEFLFLVDGESVSGEN